MTSAGNCHIPSTGGPATLLRACATQSDNDDGCGRRPHWASTQSNTCARELPVTYISTAWPRSAGSNLFPDIFNETFPPRKVSKVLSAVRFWALSDVRYPTFSVHEASTAPANNHPNNRPQTTPRPCRGSAVPSTLRSPCRSCRHRWCSAGLSNPGCTPLHAQALQGCGCRHRPFRSRSG